MYTSAADESILNMFSDSSSISDPAKKYVAVAVEQGLISGYDDSTFRGQSTITRAEAAAMLSRAFPNVTGSSESNANDPQTTNQPLSKPYKVDTLKSVDLKYPTLQSTYDYEGNKIYYLDGMDVYELIRTQVIQKAFTMRKI